jgi:hypothetical protein
VFSKPASGTWQDATQTAKLPQDNGGSTVGVAVSEDGVTIMIGSLSTTASGAGRADVFYEPGSTWPSETPTLELGGADIPSSAPLTHSVAISDDGSTAVIGSSGNPEGGAVTVFSGLSSTLAEPGISTAPPTITGTAVEGDVLAASTGTWNNLPTSYAYVWEHCSATGQQCSPIPGATGQTYTLTASDVGQRIAVEVTAANQWGTGMPAVSAATGAVPESGPVGLEIDNGNYATDDPNVTIEATWPVGTQSILISNNGGFRTDTETVPPAATIPWKLEQTGTDRLPKTVYVRFLGVGQDDINFTDDIILDETAPTIESATLNGAGSAQASAARASKLRTYRLRLKAKDELVGVCEGATNQRRSSKGQTLAPLTSCQARGVLKLSRTLELKLRSRPRYARIRNSAGDWSRWIPVTS